MRQDAPPPRRLALELAGVSKVYSDFRVRDVALGFPQGSFTVLLGPSGSGKTTLLRLIAGLEAPDSGRILLDGADVARVPAERRGVALVFQDGALFPHLDVRGNVAFGLAAKRLDRGIAEDALALVGLDALARRRVHDLSGGERARVALARALAPVLAGAAPRVLLLDEPFAALDRPLREDLRRRVVELHRRLGLTTVLVTHDREEALALSDRVALVRDGAVVETGATRDVHASPRTAFAARFLGGWNVLDADACRALDGPAPPEGHALALAPAAFAVRAGERALVEESGWATGRAVVDVGGVRLVVDDRERALAAGTRVDVEVGWEKARALPER